MKHVSATQIKLFTSCPRAWFCRYKLGIKTPKTPAQDLGSNVHEVLEIYLLTGQITDVPILRPFVEAAIPHLPTPPIHPSLVERRAFLDTFPGGPKWMLVIDLLIDTTPPTIHDHKTTSDFRYALTPAEIQEDTQCVSYTKWLQLQQDEPTDVRARLLYLNTRNKTKIAFPVDAILTPAQVTKIWARDLLVVREMVAANDLQAPEQLPANTRSCGNYGGCPYRTNCGLEIITNPGTRSKIIMSDFVARLKAAQAAQAAQAAAGTNGTTGQVAQADVPVVAPDMADPTTPVVAVVLHGQVVTAGPTTPVAVQPEAAPKGRGRPTMTDEEKEAAKRKRTAERALAKAQAALAKAQEDLAPAPKVILVPPTAPAATQVATTLVAAVPVAAVTPVGTMHQTNTDAPVASNTITIPAAAAPPAKTGAGPGFFLYIDCFPVKPSGITAVLFDDWISGVVKTINENLDEGDFRLLGFSKEKLALSAGIETHLDRVPPILIVSTSSSLAKDALQTLIPHAAVVIRAMR